MFSHVMVGSNDIERSKTFYDALFAAIGGKPGRVDPKGRLSYLHKGAAFMVSAGGLPRQWRHDWVFLDGPEQVEAWHKAGTASGGATCEDPPGRREGSFGPLYLAYLRDPDGNKLCALYRMPG